MEQAQPGVEYYSSYRLGRILFLLERIEEATRQDAWRFSMPPQFEVGNNMSMAYL